MVKKCDRSPLGSAAISLRMKVTIAGTIPIINPNTMMNKLHILGDLNRNETQYVKPADAGPNKKRVDIVPDATLLSLVINASSPVA